MPQPISTGQGCVARTEVTGSEGQGVRRPGRGQPGYMLPECAGVGTITQISISSGRILVRRPEGLPAAEDLLVVRRHRTWPRATPVHATAFIALLILLLALAILVPPLALEAQQAGGKVPRVGYLSGASHSRREEAFREGLRELGYIDGKNIVVEYRFADGQYEQLPRFATELAHLDVAVIIAATTPAIRAVQRVTQTIPIVMTLGEAAEGTIASHARPGGNITGLSTINTELTGKRLELLKEALPRLSRVAVLYNPSNPISPGQLSSAQAAGRTLGVQVQLVEVRTIQDFEAALETATRGRADALMAMPDQVFGDTRNRFVELVMKHRLPTMSWTAGHAQSGALMAYGPDEPEMHRRAATYVDKILKGAKPGDLPIEQPTKFELIINLKTAKVLRLTIPPSLLLRASRVIE